MTTNSCFGSIGKTTAWVTSPNGIVEMEEE